MSIYIGDKEIKNLFVGESTSISDMQGPCPDGFHVPLSSEWVALCGILTSTFGMAQGSTTMGTYLKIPMAGYRFYDSASVTSVGNYGVYWSSTPRATVHAYELYFSSSYIGPQNYDLRTSGYSIRSFKNEAVQPDDRWTVLYQGTGSAGVFWNSTDGLISVSGDGTTRYTIQDKNLGATTVFNQGDTLTDANCGYFYQWGNNYGFAHSGTVTTSSTQVNASTYGPGNYYSSSTFIIRSSSPYDWSSVQNDNLWGGVSQKTEENQNVKEVYLGTTKVRPSVQPVSVSFSYTGSDQTWTVPYTQDYIITCKGAGSNTSAGGLGQGTITLTKGTVLKIMVGQSGSSTSSGTYGFGGTSNYSNNRSGGGLSGVFTGSEAITATSSARALVIGGGAGGGTSGRAGGVGGGTTGATGGGSNYGTAGGGGTQTGRGSGGNAGSEQFRGGNGSGTYGWGGGGGWWGGNSSIGDGSGDDDKGAGGGSGYVISTASNRVLTQGGGSTSGNHGSVTIVSVGNESSTPVTPGGCFLKGTTILMKEGCKNIEDIVEGDVVLSFNEEKGEIEYNNVVNFIKHPYNGKIIKLNGGLIEATSNHPVYTSKDKENRDYEFIGDIVEGDWLYTKDGYVQVVEKEERDYSGDVYNFTVDNNHNYFVGDGILVHNATTGSGIQ